MVLKLSGTSAEPDTSFESDVISDGTQTWVVVYLTNVLFESDVISDGTQTFFCLLQDCPPV